MKRAAIEGPKKGTEFGMCEHVAHGPTGGVHWHLIVAAGTKRRRLEERLWVCLCPGCHARAEVAPNAAFPATLVTAFDELNEDVQIDEESTTA